MKDKLYKVVFTLASGKSIVYTMVEENALKVFSDWKKFKDAKEVNTNILEITKAKDGTISEKLGIEYSKIDSIQIDDVSGYTN